MCNYIITYKRIKLYICDLNEKKEIIIARKYNLIFLRTSGTYSISK